MSAGSVRVRFKSSFEHEKITFSGLQISVGELREKIKALKLGRATKSTLELTDPLSRRGLPLYLSFSFYLSIFLYLLLLPSHSLCVCVNGLSCIGYHVPAIYSIQ